MNLELGQRFGRWTIVASGKDSQHRLCECDCGRLQDVPYLNLTLGYTHQCQPCEFKSRFGKRRGPYKTKRKRNEQPEI